METELKDVPHVCVGLLASSGDPDGWVTHVDKAGGVNDVGAVPRFSVAVNKERAKWWPGLEEGFRIWEKRVAIGVGVAALSPAQEPELHKLTKKQLQEELRVRGLKFRRADLKDVLVGRVRSARNWKSQ